MVCKYNEIIMCDRAVADCSTCAVGMAIQSRDKELEQFKEIGLTPDQLREVDRLYTEKCQEVAVLQKKYEAAVNGDEKQTPKKPNLEGDGYSDGQLVYDTWICPCCEKHYEVDYDNYDYCPNCGQAIDWSDSMAKCKYPNEVCANMTVLNGETYCDSIPCSLKDELPKKTNADRIRSMSDQELAEFLCKVKADYQWADHEFPSEEECGEWENWLQSEVEE